MVKLFFIFSEKKTDVMALFCWKIRTLLSEGAGYHVFTIFLDHPCSTCTDIVPSSTAQFRSEGCQRRKASASGNQKNLAKCHHNPSNKCYDIQSGTKMSRWLNVAIKNQVTSSCCRENSFSLGTFSYYLAALPLLKWLSKVCLQSSDEGTPPGL